MKRKTTEKLTVILLVAAFLALSACRTCKCPAYSYKQDNSQQDIIQTQPKPAASLIPPSS